MNTIEEEVPLFMTGAAHGAGANGGLYRSALTILYLAPEEEELMSEFNYAGHAPRSRTPRRARRDT